MNKLFFLAMVGTIGLSTAVRGDGSDATAFSVTAATAKGGITAIMRRCLGSVDPYPATTSPAAFQTVLKKIGYLAERNLLVAAQLEATLLRYGSAETWLRIHPTEVRAFARNTDYVDAFSGAEDNWPMILDRANTIGTADFLVFARFEALMMGRDGDAVAWFESQPRQFMAWARQAFPHFSAAFDEPILDFDYVKRTLELSGPNEFALLAGRVGDIIRARFDAEVTLMLHREGQFNSVDAMLQNRPAEFYRWASSLPFVLRNHLGPVFARTGRSYAELLDLLVLTAKGDFHARAQAEAVPTGFTSPQSRFASNPSSYLFWMRETFPDYLRAFLPVQD